MTQNAKDANNFLKIQSTPKSEYINPDYDPDAETLFQGTPVDLDLMIYSAGRKSEKKRKFFSCCIYVPFIIIVTMYMFFGYQIFDGHFLHHGMKRLLLDTEFPNVNDSLLIRKAFDDVGQPDEYMQWLQGVLLKHVFNETDYAEDPKPQKDMRTIVLQNRLIGALRIRQHRVKPKPKTSKYIPALPNFDQYIYPAYSWKNRDTEPFGPNKEWKYGTCEEVGNANRYYSRASGNLPCESHYLIIPFNTSYEEVMELGEYMSDNEFLDRQTRSLIHEFFVYNPNLNYFTSCKTVFEIVPGGSIIGTYEFKSFRMATFRDNSNYVYFAFSMLLPCFLIFYVFQFFNDLRRHIKYSRPEKRWYLFFIRTSFPYINIGNALEILNFLLLSTSLMMRLIFYFHPTRLQFNIDAISKSNNPYPSNLESMMYYINIDEVVVAISCVITWFKIIRYFSLDDRLNLLSVTLRKATFDVFSVAITLLICILAFSLAGNLLFGYDMDDFKDFVSSYSILLRMLIGENNYEEMKEESRLLFPFFFILFIIFGCFLVINMFLAVIEDGFEDATKEVLDTGLGIEWEKVVEAAKLNIKKSFGMEPPDDDAIGGDFSFNQGDDEVIERLKQFQELRGDVQPLTFDDLRSALKGAHKKILERIMRRLDENEDEQIDLHELEKIRNKRLSGSTKIDETEQVKETREQKEKKLLNNVRVFEEQLDNIIRALQQLKEKKNQ